MNQILLHTSSPTGIRRFFYVHQPLHNRSVCWNHTGLKKSHEQQGIYSDPRLSPATPPCDSWYCQRGSEPPQQSSRSKAAALTKWLKGELSKQSFYYTGSLGLTGTSQKQRVPAEAATAMVIAEMFGLFLLRLQIAELYQLA